MEWPSHDANVSLAKSVLSKAKSIPDWGLNSVTAPLSTFTATILTEQYWAPAPPLQEDSAENRAMISRVLPAGTETGTAAPGTLLKATALEKVVEVSLTIWTRWIEPPLAIVSSAKAVPLAKIIATAKEASSSIVRLILSPYLSLAPLPSCVPLTLPRS